MSARLCPECGGSLDGMACNVKYCGATCALEARREAGRLAYWKTKGQPAPPKQVRPMTWVAPKPRPRPKPSVGAIACSTCAHGVPSAQAVSGWECRAACAMSCGPLGAQRHWKAKEARA